MNRLKKERPSGRPRVSRAGPASLRTMGLVAAGGFLIGVVWPRLAGVSLVPEAPVEELAGTPAEEVVEPGTEIAARSEGSAAEEVKPLDTLEIGESEITSCRDSARKEQKSCDAVDVDALVHGALRSLAQCEGARGAFGTLSLGFELDFEKNQIGGVKSGRSTDLPKAPAEELLRCAKQALGGVKLEGAGHEHASYSVYYRLRFKTPEAALADQATVVPASGHALVEWRTALVRENPERGAKVVARVLAGARLIVTGRQGDWYRVKYDARGREGWVHGAALGLGK